MHLFEKIEKFKLLYFLKFESLQHTKLHLYKTSHFSTFSKAGFSFNPVIKEVNREIVLSHTGTYVDTFIDIS